MSEQILHFAGVRLRITGSGLLRMQYRTLDAIRVKEFDPYTMEPSTEKEPTRLVNFKSQRGFLKVYTSSINETFTINKIIQYVKPLYDNFPD